MHDDTQHYLPNSGSRWHRWDPHIHSPGTVLNDQFTGSSSWETYLTALETASPPIRAVGITDYYSTGCYERVCAAKAAGRLPHCELIFPNVEMRLAYGTVKGKWVNLHLLVSPEDPNHLHELSRFLNRLTFNADDDFYCCNKDDLTRLGQRCNSSLTNPDAALEHGSEQFKVSFDQLKSVYGESGWAQKNILIAVAGGETDGTSGIRQAADTTLRREVERFAHLIFASSQAQREFWLGQRGVSGEELEQRYDGLKPCMHGCDAHELRKVGVPDGDRYSWIKGAIEFDALRQACIDPAGRAYVGVDAPVGATQSQVISEMRITDASWAKTPTLHLNPGLVAVIGPRGSGKTALADMIALGCDAMPEQLHPASFLERARDLLGDAVVSLHWEDGAECERRLDRLDPGSSAEYPRARYLSQQFVEELCCASGMTDVLMREVERVIFEAHSVPDRDGAADFNELLETRAARYRRAREREEMAMGDICEQIGIEREKQQQLEPLKKQIAEKVRLINGYTTDRSKLVAKGSEARLQRLRAYPKTISASN